MRDELRGALGGVLIDETCEGIRSSFSAYLDGAVSGREMQEIARHLEGSTDSTTGAKVPGCEGCAREFREWRAAQDALALLGPAKAPADLGLKLRVAISRESARRNSRLMDRLQMRWENALQPMLLQVSAGVAATAFLVGSMMALLGAVAPANSPVLADDEPLAGITQPHYLYSTTAPAPIVCGHNSPIIVEAAVDSSGRVYDYSIVSGNENAGVEKQVASQLLGQVFQPATVFGTPVRGRVVVTFSGISVRA